MMSQYYFLEKIGYTFGTLTFVSGSRSVGMMCDEVYLEKLIAYKQHLSINTVILVEYTIQVDCRTVHIQQFV